MRVGIALLGVALIAACVSRSPRPVRGERNSVEVYLLQIPRWMDPYFDDAGEKLFLDVESVMMDFDLTRLEAVEVQNQMKDALAELYAVRSCEKPSFDEPNATLQNARCFTPHDREAAFLRALRSVRAGHIESGWSEELAQSAPFIVVFDLDETALWIDSNEGQIVTSPGFPEALENVRARGGLIAIFTAKPDADVQEVMRSWTLMRNGKEVLVSSLVDGLFSQNHLTVQSHGSARDRTSVSVPSKDLRVLDPGLTKVLLIDDNPGRVFQHRRLRYVRKWMPKEGNASFQHQEQFWSGLFDDRFERVSDEVNESLRWMHLHRTDFATAYLPYTYRAQPVVQALALSVTEGDGRQARDLIRQHPDLVDPDE